MGDTSTTLSIILKLVDDASSGLAGVTGTIEKNRAAIQGLAIGAAAVSAAFVGFAKTSIDAYSESEDIVTQLNAVIKSTGDVSGVTAEAAIKLSKALESTTSFSDETVLSTENLLLTFTKISKDTMPEATTAVLNIATALKEDTSDAAIQLGKALQDPITGITALHRVGVDFSDAQKAVIKSLVDTGQTAAAQQVILHELNTEFGGSAQAAAETYSGKVAQLGNQFNDMQEIVGQALVPVLLQLAQALVPIISAMAAWIEKHPELTKWIIILGGGLAMLVAVLASFALILPGIIAAVGLLGTMIGLISGPVLLAGVAIGTFAAIVLSHWNDIKAGTQVLVDFITRAFNTITAPIKAITGAVSGAVSYVGGGISSVLSKIPGFATGGIVNGPTLAMVGEAGPEAIIPLSAFAGGGGLGGGRGGGAGIVVNINGGSYLDSNGATMIGNALAAKIVQQMRTRNYAV